MKDKVPILASICATLFRNYVKLMLERCYGTLIHYILRKTIIHSHEAKDGTRPQVDPMCDEGWVTLELLIVARSGIGCEWKQNLKGRMC